MTPAAFRTALEGQVVPAVPVPFREDGTFDAELHHVYVTWMAGQPVGGVAVWAHTGRGLRLEPSMREKVLAAWKEGFPHPVVAGVGPDPGAGHEGDPSRRSAEVMRSATAMAADARRLGADGLLLHPPTALRDLPDAGDRIVAYHEALADTGLPCLAFLLYAAAGGVPWSSGVRDRILAIPGVVGVKVATLDSVMTWQDVAAAVRASGSLLVTGEDRFLGYSLMGGADAALVGIAAALPDRAAALICAARAVEPGFVQQSNAMDRFARATFRDPMDGYVQRMLWAIEADGIWSRPAYDPFGPRLAPGEREAVMAAARAFRNGT